MTNDIVAELRALAPWPYDLPVADGISILAGNLDDAGDNLYPNIRVVATTGIERLLRALYPNGMQQKTMLDVACNGGAHSFLGHRLGADFVYGFDVRQHGIDQAMYLKERYEIEPSRLTFACHHVDDLPQEGVFNVAIFSGIFYHLPAPVGVIRNIADRTKEAIYLRNLCISLGESSWNSK